MVHVDVLEISPVLSDDISPSEVLYCIILWHIMLCHMMFCYDYEATDPPRGVGCRWFRCKRLHTQTAPKGVAQGCG